MGVIEDPSYDPERAAGGGESGYSLVEVVAAIMILALAILPMVGMFDAALPAARSSAATTTVHGLWRTRSWKRSGRYPTASPAVPRTA